MGVRGHLHLALRRAQAGEFGVWWLLVMHNQALDLPGFAQSFLEGGFDSSHLSFLHGGSAHKEMAVVPTRYEVIPTNFGFVAGSGRDMGADGIFWTANVMLMPFHKIISSIPHAAHVWAPIDDEHTMLYSVDFHPSRPLIEADLARSKAGLSPIMRVPGPTASFSRLFSCLMRCTSTFFSTASGIV